MEPTPEKPAADTPAPCPGQPELIVENGRQRGERRPVKFPVTLIGRAAGCDIRLNAGGVGAMHCALVPTPDGILLRDLQGEGATQVNGQPASVCTLRTGDRLAIGPFRFEVRLPITAAPDGSAAASLSPEEQLRQQREKCQREAAEVASRKAAVIEEEARLEQRRQALQQQRSQFQARLRQEREKLRQEADAQLVQEKERLRREFEGRVAKERDQLRREFEDRIGPEREALRRAAAELAARQAALTEEERRIQQRWLALDQSREQAQARLREEKEALRIQAAAVAAQQAALSEEEARLQQRRTALQQQEEQLSAHLEEKQRHIQQLQEQARQERTALREERSAYEQRVVQVMKDVAAARAEVEDGKRQVQAQRQHLHELRRRLKRRWHRHWAAERAAIRRREAELDRRRAAVEKEHARLQEDRQAVRDARLRFNGEAELSRRQLQAEWSMLRQARWQLDEEIRRHRAEVEQRAQVLDRREADLADAELELADLRAQAEDRRRRIDREVEGLENRVRNHRRKVQELEQEIALRELQLGLPPGGRLVAEPARAAAALPAPARPLLALLPPGSPDAPAPDTAAAKQSPPLLPAVPREWDSELSALEELAHNLADQRLQLLEQWERLLRAQQSWCLDHAAATAEMETVGRRLAAREQAVKAAEDRVRARQAELAQTWQHLEAWQAKMAAREAAWEAERDRLLAELHERERLLERRLAAVTELHQSWVRRRRSEVERLRGQREEIAQLRKECAAAREEWLRRSAALEQEQRSLAERSLAVEQYRQECIKQALKPAAVERRLEQMRRRWAAAFAAGIQDLSRERKALREEADVLEQGYRSLKQLASKVAAQEVELAEHQAAWERDRLLAEDEADRLRSRLQLLQAQRQRYEQERGQLREEVDRLAHLLMLDENERALPPTSQAA